jgi:hypothetical protein
MKQLILLLVTVALCNAGAAQSRKERKDARRDKINAMIKQEEEGVIIYHKHNILGLGLATDGYGAIFEKGWKQDKRKSTLLRFELYEKKHLKEDRVTNVSVLGAANSFIYGKLNNFYQFRAGYGIQRVLGSKGNKNGIEVSAIGIGGLSLGLAKPYFYDAADSTGKRTRVKFSTSVNPYGSSGFTVGWNELKMKPGAFARTGLRFDYGRFNETVSAIDVGLITEFYAGKIPQMFGVKQKQFFLSGYVNILFGRRK